MNKGDIKEIEASFPLGIDFRSLPPFAEVVQNLLQGYLAWCNRPSCVLLPFCCKVYQDIISRCSESFAVHSLLIPLHSRALLMLTRLKNLSSSIPVIPCGATGGRPTMCTTPSDMRWH